MPQRVGVRTPQAGWRPFFYCARIVSEPDLSHSPNRPDPANGIRPDTNRATPTATTHQYPARLNLDFAPELDIRWLTCLQPCAS